LEAHVALRYKTRKRLALLILVLGVPAYIMSAVTVMSLFERPSIWVEFLVYVGMGIVWILPLKPIFKGVGQADPDEGHPPER
jgi:predicted membrane channel-forming protein YqfA (hemolysin III family)